MSGKRSIVGKKKVEGDYYIQDNIFLPIDRYDEDTNFKVVCGAADKYHFLMIPLMGQWCNKKDNKGKLPADYWCGRTAYSMVYNWHVLVNESSPKDKYIRMNVYGDNQSWDLRHASNNLEAFKNYSSTLIKGNENGMLLDYSRKYLAPSPQPNNISIPYQDEDSRKKEMNRVYCEHSEKKLFEIFEDNIISSLNRNYPVVIYTAIYPFNLTHIILISGYCFINGDLFFMICDPAHLYDGKTGAADKKNILECLSTDGMKDIKKSLKDAHEIIPIIKGDWYNAMGSLYLLRARSLFKPYPTKIIKRWVDGKYIDQQTAPSALFPNMIMMDYQTHKVSKSKGYDGGLILYKPGKSKLPATRDLIVSNINEKISFPLQKAGDNLESVMNYYFRSEEAPVYPAQADSREEQGEWSAGSREETGGYYLAGLNQTVHGGVHIMPQGGKGVVRSIAPGYIVAARLDAKPVGDYDRSMAASYFKNFTNFILIRHEMVIEDEKVPFYSLYMHLRPAGWLDTSGQEAVIIKDAYPDNPADYDNIEWVGKLVSMGVSEVISLEPQGKDGKRYFNSKAAVSDGAAKCAVYGLVKELILKDGERIKGVVRETDESAGKAFAHLNKGNVIVFDKPYLKVKRGEPIGLVERVGLQSLGFLHFEIIAPEVDGSNAMQELIDLYEASDMFNEFSEVTGDDNFLDPDDLKKVYELLPKDNEENAKKMDDKLGASDSQMEKSIEDLLKRIESAKKAGDKDKTNLSILYARVSSEIAKYYKSYLTSGIRANDNGKFTYRIKLKLEEIPFTSSSQKVDIICYADLRQETMKARCSVTIGQLNSGYDLDIPYNTMVLSLQMANGYYLELDSSQELAEARKKFFKYMTYYRFRNVLLKHKAEWSETGIETLLDKIEEAGFITSEQTDALKEELKKSAWWNAEVTNNPESPGIFPVLGDNIFRDDFLPPDNDVCHLHPVTAIWLMKILAEEGKIELVEDFIIDEEEVNKALFYGFTGDEKPVAGSAHEIIVIGKNKNSSESFELKVEAKQGHKIELGTQSFDDKGVAVTAVPADFYWGDWTIKLDGLNKEGSNRGVEQLAIPKPVINREKSFLIDPISLASETEEEIDSYLYDLRLHFDKESPEALGGYLFFQYKLQKVDEEEAEEAEKSEWVESKYSMWIDGVRESLLKTVKEESVEEKKDKKSDKSQKPDFYYVKQEPPYLGEIARDKLDWGNWRECFEAADRVNGIKLDSWYDAKGNVVKEKHKGLKGLIIPSKRLWENELKEMSDEELAKAVEAMKSGKKKLHQWLEDRKRSDKAEETEEDKSQKVLFQFELEDVLRVMRDEIGWKEGEETEFAMLKVNAFLPYYKMYERSIDIKDSGISDKQSLKAIKDSVKDYMLFIEDGFKGLSQRIINAKFERVEFEMAGLCVKATVYYPPELHDCEPGFVDMDAEESEKVIKGMKDFKRDDVNRNSMSVLMPIKDNIGGEKAIKVGLSDPKPEYLGIEYEQKYDFTPEFKEMTAELTQREGTYYLSVRCRTWCFPNIYSKNRFNMMLYIDDKMVSGNYFENRIGSLASALCDVNGLFFTKEIPVTKGTLFEQALIDELNEGKNPTFKIKVTLYKLELCNGYLGSSVQALEKSFTKDEIFLEPVEVVSEGVESENEEVKADE